jgi:hypothetical protein
VSIPTPKRVINLMLYVWNIVEILPLDKRSIC